MSPTFSTPRTDAEWSAIIEAAATAITVSNAPNAPPVQITKTIDHTLLKLDATPEQIDQLCEEAHDYDFATVCVRPNYVARSVEKLAGSNVEVASVIGFHEGTYDTAHKLNEVRESLQAGASELDVVLNWPDLKGSRYSKVFTELTAIRQAAPSPTLLKLIFETSQLDQAKIIAACVLASAAEFDYVKTSTGFLGHGAKVEDIRLMSACCDHLSSKGQNKMLVKASGGVRSLQDAITMLEAGASRLGTSAGVSIAAQAKERTVSGHGQTQNGIPGGSTDY